MTTKCFGFQWIGQSFKWCDGCGKPYWEHTHEDVHREGAPFGRTFRRVISAEKREAVRRKWEGRR